MSYPFLIEIRPLLEKFKLRGTIKRLGGQLHLGRVQRVPHLTLVYNFRPKINDYEIARIIQRTARAYPDLSFRYADWDFKKGRRGHVIAFKIEPSEGLRKFRHALYNEIQEHIVEDPQNTDYNQMDVNDYWFHAAVVCHLPSWKIDKAIDYLEEVEKLTEENNTTEKPTEHTGLFGPLFSLWDSITTPRSISKYPVKPLYLPAETLRICMLGRSRIRYEYDTLSDRILTRQQALSRYYKGKTLYLYRKKMGVEVNAQPPSQKGKRIWLIGDTHFGHQNIIWFCARPFTSVREMDHILKMNWNYCIKPEDTVYFLGDLTKGINPSYFEKELNGQKIFIGGNHDPDGFGINSTTLEYKGYKFLFAHDPKEVRKFDGWLIHGHTHNNDIKNYPFINGEKRTINVGVELINYQPLDIEKLLALDISSIRRMDTLTSKPERW